MDNQTILIAFLLTLFAGLSTGIGSLIAFIAKRTNTNFLSLALGLSAGVMIYVSFMEMLPKSLASLTDIFGEKTGMLYMILGLFGGIALIALIDFLIPESRNPHEMHGVEEMKSNYRLKQTGIITAITIAIHNIPEGIAVAVPIYHSTGSKKKAFWLSFTSGLAEPLGAMIAFFFLLPFWSPLMDALVLAAVAGIMIYISLDELLPSAEKYGKHHLSIIGLVSGMAVMAISLFLFI